MSLGVLHATAPRPASRLLARAEAALHAQRGHLFLWAPVCLGLGIGIYMGLRTEPGWPAWLVVGSAGLLALVAGSRAGQAWAPLFLGLALVAGGAGLAGLRTHAVAAPVLSFRYYGPVEGRIVGIDRSASDALRLTLDRVVLEDVAPARTPARVRVSLHGDQRWLVPEPGRTVILTGHLSPPQGPAEPGAFDFRRSAWFDRLGAVGYTRTPVLTATPPERGLWVHRLRTWLSDGLRSRIPGDPGGLAAAVTTGDRSGISQAANEAMRDSGLYHVVSISGMHMALLVGFTFGCVRGAIALVPPLALRADGKKVAALVALPVAAFYLLLAGRDVATERAFVMVAVMLGAILLDRRALSLRSVAIAALVVLLQRPESLVNVGFQMSFAAATALTLAFSVPWRGQVGARWAWAVPPLTLVLSSLVAGLATGPIAAAQFGRYSAYGLLANLLAGPAMAILVMPGAALLAVGAGLGLMQPALLMIELGCAWVLFVAERVATIEGATGAIPAPPGTMLPLLALGSLWAVLWRGRARWLGLVGPVVAALLWLGAERPPLLIAASGGVIGVLGPEGRALSHGTGEAFTTESWLARDGDVATAEEAAARPGLFVEGRVARATLGGRGVVVARGKTALAALDGCDGADLLLTDADDAGERPCLALDASDLRDLGSVAGRVESGRLVLVTAAEAAGRRPWSRGDEGGAPASLPLDP